MVKRLGILGIVITTGYLCAWGFLVYHRSDKFAGMELNAIGDFLGGSFGPLAFLWLVLGFFQQREELKQNTAALRLQAEELRRTAEHAAAMVDVARKDHAIAQAQLTEQQRRSSEAEERAQAEAKRRRKQQIQPRFTFHERHMVPRSDADRREFVLENGGHGCRDVEITLEGSEDIKLPSIRVPTFEAHASEQVRFEHTGRNSKARLDLRYTDGEGDAHALAFLVTALDMHISVELAPHLRRPSDAPKG